MGFLPQKLVNRLSRKEELPPLEKTSFRIGDIKAKQPLGLFLKIAGPLLDRIFGTHQLHIMFHRYKLWKYEGKEFLDHFIPATGVRYSFDGKGLLRIPKTGRTLMIANHPHGGIEGVILSHALASRRDDYKLFVNVMLYFIKELARFFIFTNPMLPGSVSNARAIRKAQQWLKAGHCLIIFPAGRVGLYRSNRGYITDESWDRMALSLCLNTNTPVYPVFIDGQCSQAFSWASRIFFPMKLLMLVNEFLRSFSRTITFYTGHPIHPDEVQSMSRIQANAYLRMRTYLLAPLSSDGLGMESDNAHVLTNQPETPCKNITNHSHEEAQVQIDELFITKIKRNDRLYLSGEKPYLLNFWNLDEINNKKRNTIQEQSPILLTFFPSTIHSSCTLKSALLLAHWLYRQLQPKMPKQAKFNKRNKLYPVPRIQSCRHPQYRLHREVEWYLNHFLLDIQVLEKVLCAIEDHPCRIPDYDDMFSGFFAAGMSYDTAGYPVLLLLHTREK